MKKLIAVAALFAANSVIAADNVVYRCENAGAERVIEVVYTQGTAVPCQVNYTKSDGVQTLWRAENTEGYCEEKAEEFVEKQRGWGWSCEAQARPEIVNPIS